MTKLKGRQHNMTKVNEVEIQNEALLVTLHIGRFSITRTDNNATSEVLKSHNAKSNAGSFSKTIVEASAMSAVIAAESAARQFHYDNTLPWDTENRMLPVTNFEAYTKGMNDKKREFMEAMAAFIVLWPEYKEKAKSQTLGSLYWETDYPTIEVIKSKFYFDQEFSPLPSGDALRQRMPLIEALGEHSSSVAESIENAVKSRTEEATASLVNRLAEPLQNLIDTLSKDKPRIFESLTGNILRAVGQIRSLNVMQDPKLNIWADEVEKRLGNTTAYDLRSDDEKRKSARLAADELLRKMEGYAA